jgi:virulence-associated protein VapD
MYAIAFDMDTDTLKKTYGSSYNNAYPEIGKCLKEHGFEWTQGSVYFGDAERINAVACVLAAMDLASRYSWFAASVRSW